MLHLSHQSPESATSLPRPALAFLVTGKATQPPAIVSSNNPACFSCRFSGDQCSWSQPLAQLSPLSPLHLFLPLLELFIHSWNPSCSVQLVWPVSGPAIGFHCQSWNQFPIQYLSAIRLLSPAISPIFCPHADLLPICSVNHLLPTPVFT